MFFSVGGHPAFRLPLTSDTQFADYYLRFEETENLARWPISPDGLILPRPIPVLEDSNRLNLKKSLFYQDALVFKYPASSDISLLSAKTTHGLVFQIGRIPFSGDLVSERCRFYLSGTLVWYCGRNKQQPAVGTKRRY